MSERLCSQEGLSQRDGARGSAPRARGDSDPMRTLAERRNLCTNCGAGASSARPLRTFPDVKGEFAVFDINSDRAALHHAASDHHVCDRGHDLRLNEALQGARAVLRVVALLESQVLRQKARVRYVSL